MPQNKVLPAASGYRQNAILNHPQFAKGFIDYQNAMTLTGNITDQSRMPSEIKSQGDEIWFKRPPKAEIFSLHKNQELQVSEPKIERIQMVIGRGAYWNLKVDDIDYKRIAEMKEIVQEYRKSAVIELAQKIDREVLLEVPLGAAACNKGRRAGARSHSIDLGAKGAPVALTAENILKVMTEMQVVIAEQNIDPQGMYIVFPQIAQALFKNNPILLNAAASGQSQSIVLANKIPNIFGFDVYFSNNTPQFTDNGVAYLIFAGKKSATGFANQLTVNRTVTPHNYFATLWQGYEVYDFKVIAPEEIVTLYATINV